MNEKNLILVVDDNKENLKVLNDFLKDMNYRIALALDGASALQIVGENKIDLILLDIMMPGMDGFEVCKILKESPKTKDIPVIFLTARTETGDIVNGFRIGGVDYITKPFNKEELYARVNSHMQLKLIRDNLIYCELTAIKSRDFFMKVLYDLGKILDRK
jgi:DNA-binding response OmpR family regulator